MAKRIRRNIFTGLLEEVDDYAGAGRQIIFRGAMPYGEQTVLGKSGCTRAVHPGKKHISKSLGVPTAQVDRFNKELEDFGVTDARYSDKSGFLESTEDNARHAAWAIRGYFNPEGGNVADRYANAIGF